MEAGRVPQAGTTREAIVSIVVVTYNNRPFVAECLSYASGQDYGSVEVIVVDQNSHDGTPELVRAKFPAVKLIRNERNTGFAAGMNRGIAASGGAYVLLLNSDLFLDSAFVSRATLQLRSYSSEDRVGMLASIVYLYKSGERTREIESLGSMLVPYHTNVNSEQIDTVEWVAGPAGSAMFLTRAMLDDIRLPSGGYLDESYFCYGEDLELALRAQVLGWRCVFAPILAGWHIGGASANGEGRYSDKPPDLLVHALKNRYLTLLSCYPAGLLLWTLPWHLLTECGQIAAPVVTGRWRMLGCLLRAYRAVFRLLPDVVAKREWLQERRCVSCAYLRSLYVRWGVVKTFESLVRKV